MTTVDAVQLEVKVKDLYRHVARDPGGPFHFPLGRALATRLGYPERWLREVPAGAVDSFAGVGYLFDLAELRPGEHVLDLGSGSGMDTFVAAALVGPSGRVVGVDMTAEQVAKARRLAAGAGTTNVTTCGRPASEERRSRRHTGATSRPRASPSRTPRERLRVPLPAGTKRQREIRREERLAGGVQAHQ
jgi:SAM-dependent methyltransferase